MTDVPGVPEMGSYPGKSPATEPWLSFEYKMRRRRFARCLLRADLAIEDRNIEGARAALDEARQLEPQSPELAELDRQFEELERSLRQLGGPAATLSEPVTAAAEPVLPQQDREPVTLEGAATRGEPKRLKYAIAFAAGLVLLSGGAYASRVWRASSVPVLPDTSADALAAVAPAAALPTSEPAPPPEPLPEIRPGLRIFHDTIAAPEATPRIAGEEQGRPVILPPPVAAPAPEPDPVVVAMNRSDNAPPVPAATLARSELRLDHVEAPPTPPETVREPPAVATSSAPARSSPTPERNSAVDELSIVRETLARYEIAYSRLDATAASAVWPAVDRRALARAFEGLASQHVSLGDCAVTVSGQAAQATCSGTATWQPKVGGGVRTEPRRWSFELRKSGEAWQIQRARTLSGKGDLD